MTAVCGRALRRGHWRITRPGLTVARLAAAREPQNDVVVALAGAAQGAQAVDHPRLEPDVALALVVDSRLEVDAAKRHG